MRSLPVPKPPLAHGAGCHCPCHASGDADLAAVAQALGDEYRRVCVNGIVFVGVERASVLEAAVACDECRRYHCPALSGRPDELDPPRWSPPPMRPALPENPAPAFGGGDGPESL